MIRVDFFILSKLGCFIHTNSFPILLPPADPRFPPWKKDLAASPSFSQDWRPAIDKKEDWERKGPEAPPGSCVKQAGKRWLHIQVQTNSHNYKTTTLSWPFSKVRKS